MHLATDSRYPLNTMSDCNFSAVAQENTEVTSNSNFNIPNYQDITNSNLELTGLGRNHSPKR